MVTYRYIDSKTEKVLETTIRPAYSIFPPEEPKNGQFWFSMAEDEWYLFDGQNWNNHPIIMYGEKRKLHSGATEHVEYNRNGFRDSGWIESDKVDSYVSKIESDRLEKMIDEANRNYYGN